jgi:hypothetical protein
MLGLVLFGDHNIPQTTDHLYPSGFSRFEQRNQFKRKSTATKGKQFNHQHIGLEVIEDLQQLDLAIVLDGGQTAVGIHGLELAEFRVGFDRWQINDFDRFRHGEALNDLATVDKTHLKVAGQTLHNFHAADQMTHAQNMLAIKQ